MQTLIVASKNKGKINEIKQILGRFYEVKSMADLGIELEIEETGTTFEENAAIKALEVYKLAGMPVLSDDSGLCVDALGGRPGVYSARFSGEMTDSANNAKLLECLQGIENRKAKFVSAVALAHSLSEVTIARGECEGTILTQAKGEGGFGYDPLFFSPLIGKTFGEATEEEKNKISHRYNALNNLLTILLAHKNGNTVQLD